MAAAASLPNLFESLIPKQVAKQPDCTKHADADDVDDLTVNCAIDGYLMYKRVDGSKWRPLGNPMVDFTPFGKPIEVVIQDRNSKEQRPMRFESVGSKSASWQQKKGQFEIQTNNWKKEFERLCTRGKGLGTISYDGFGEALFKNTDWYCIDDEQKKGQIFVWAVDNVQRRKMLHVTCQGVFQTNFLFLTLVCAEQGHGAAFLDAAEAVCARLGYDGILLSALSNAAGAYFSRGYRFVSRTEGKQVAVDSYVKWNKETNKLMLSTTMLPVAPVQSDKRPREDRASEERKYLYFDDTMRSITLLLEQAKAKLATLSRRPLDDYKK